MKFEEHGKKGGRVAVAPLAGAWIEIMYPGDDSYGCVVAPLAGAWIEMIVNVRKKQGENRSLPSRERGLKFNLAKNISLVKIVAPLAGAWIEITNRQTLLAIRKVAPLAGAWIEIYNISYVSSLLGVAPLAGAWIEIRIRLSTSTCRSDVAPLAGAWIEIINIGEKCYLTMRRSPRGSVD